MFQPAHVPEVIGDELSVPLGGFVLPAVCSKCARTDGLQPRLETLRWTSAGTYALAAVLAPFGLLFSVLVIALGSKRMAAVFPVCPPCDARWRNAKVFRVVALLAPLPIAVVLAAVGAVGPLGALAVFFASLIVLPVATSIVLVQPATVRAAAIGPMTARIAGLGRAMRDAVASAPDRRAFVQNVGHAPAPSFDWVALVLGLFALPAFGVLAVLGVFGVRTYVARAKVSEARIEIARIARAAAEVHASTRRICPSATQPVPADASAIAGMRYSSTEREWRHDAMVGAQLIPQRLQPEFATEAPARRGFGAGFACIGYEIRRPQYFQYDYQANDGGFVATARGDLNGDGVLSRFTVVGRLDESGAIVVDPITEENPTE